MLDLLCGAALVFALALAVALAQLSAAMVLIPLALSRAVRPSSPPDRSLAGLRWRVTHARRVHLGAALLTLTLLTTTATPAGLVGREALAYEPERVVTPDLSNLGSISETALEGWSPSTPPTVRYPQPLWVWLFEPERRAWTGATAWPPPPWWVNLVGWTGAPFLLGLLVGPLAGRRWRAEVSADRGGLRVARPWPFRSRSWRWDDVVAVEAQGRTLIVTTLVARYAISGGDSPPDDAASVADWLAHPPEPTGDRGSGAAPSALRTLRSAAYRS